MIFIQNVVVILGSATECYTSNGQTKKSNDDGVLYECRMEAGATVRKCLKFTRGVYENNIFVVNGCFGMDNL